MKLFVHRCGSPLCPSLRYGFVGDDLIYFIGNQYIRSFDVWTILRSGAIGADYLPLRDLSFALDYLLWGENPFGFHLMNVLLFGITVVSVKHLFAKLNAFLAGPRATSAETPAFLAAFVFALHPNNREVVYAIFNRGALLTVFFQHPVLPVIYQLSPRQKREQPIILPPPCSVTFWRSCRVNTASYCR